MKQNEKSFKPKFTLTIYQKSFKSIESMVKEFRELHPEFSNIFSYEETVIPSQMAHDALMYFANNNPDITNRTNLPLAINVSANKVSLKTNKFFSVEWSFKYDREGNISDLNASIGVFSREKNSNELEDLITNLTSYSWKIMQR